MLPHLELGVLSGMFAGHGESENPDTRCTGVGFRQVGFALVKVQRTLDSLSLKAAINLLGSHIHPRLLALKRN